MKTIAWIVLGSSLFLSGCVGAVFTGANAYYNRYNLTKKINDFQISYQIKNAIANDPLLAKPCDVSVATFNRIVLLSGRVPNEATRLQAAKLASQVPNTAHVFNAITIGPPLTSAETANDTWITTKIKTQFIAENDLAPGTIKIVTENGVVYLLGIVSRDQADIAVEIARNTTGVNRVVKIFFYVIMPKID